MYTFGVVDRIDTLQYNNYLGSISIVMINKHFHSSASKLLKRHGIENLHV
jgi:hypothetical protein